MTCPLCQCKTPKPGVTACHYSVIYNLDGRAGSASVRPGTSHPAARIDWGLPPSQYYSVPTTSIRQCPRSKHGPPRSLAASYQKDPPLTPSSRNFLQTQDKFTTSQIAPTSCGQLFQASTGGDPPQEDRAKKYPAVRSPLQKETPFGRVQARSPLPRTIPPHRPPTRAAALRDIGTAPPGQRVPAEHSGMWGAVFHLLKSIMGHPFIAFSQSSPPPLTRVCK